ncbi:MAG: tRNA dihydrouridine(20/20a) synthase DusA [Caulobacteraceae bacterium]|nr:tRNA dihydrouridine(20/20a) synthase DusA [Caulobacteraceae bacterium]
MTFDPHRFCIAPMMDWTDRHCRAFHRTLTARARLYTEMVTAAAVLHGDRERLLGFEARERPLALQLGGCDPSQLASAARVGEDFGYDEVNLNVGCPSDRVQTGRFGACLMREPALVAECVGAMIGAVRIPVTVKCRLGVDDQDPEESLFALVDSCVAAGVTTFVVHARKAWLQGLSPKDNREIPPLDWSLVARLKRERPSLTVVINGGVTSLDSAESLLDGVDGVMIGRAAYHDPSILGAVDARLFGDPDVVAPEDAVERYKPYVARALARGVRLPAMARHMLGLFQGRPGARAWRRILTVDSHSPGAGLEVIDRALTAVGSSGQPRLAA